MSLLAARTVELGYGPLVVLREVTLEIGPGEFFFFLGPNGTGKTTLLHAFLGLLKPRQGEVLRPHPQAIGLVPQRCDPNPALRTTVTEFVRTGLVGLRLRRREERERVAWALARVGLSDRADAAYRSLSGGQRQRALVARALVRRPQVFLADEPTAGLDPTTQQHLLELFHSAVTAGGQTVVFVTHDLALARRYAGRVALFAGGRVTVGKAAEMLRPETLRRTYGALPPAWVEPAVAGGGTGS